MSHAVAVTTSVATPVETDSVASPPRRSRRRAPRCWKRSTPRTSATTSATWPRASEWSPTSSPASARATSAGAGRSPSPAPTGSAPSPSTRSCCCPATTRSSRRSGCPTASGSSRATCRPATCCPSPTTTRGWCRRTSSATTRSTPTTRRSCATVAKDLGLGRVRTLSIEGRDLAAQRWYDGDAGPDAPISQSAPEPCTTCGFLVRIAGPLVGDVRGLRQRRRQRRRPGGGVRPRLRRALGGAADQAAGAPADARARLRHGSASTRSTSSN